MRSSPILKFAFDFPVSLIPNAAPTPALRNYDAAPLSNSTVGSDLLTQEKANQATQTKRLVSTDEEVVLTETYSQPTSTRRESHRRKQGQQLQQRSQARPESGRLTLFRGSVMNDLQFLNGGS